MFRKLIAASLFGVACCATLYAARAADEAPPPRPVPSVEPPAPEPKSEARPGRLFQGKLRGKIIEKLAGNEKLMNLKEKLKGKIDIETVKDFMKDFDLEVILDMIEKFKSGNVIRK